MLLDLDLAKEVGGGRSGARYQTGILVAMQFDPSIQTIQIYRNVSKRRPQCTNVTSQPHRPSHHLTPNPTAHQKDNATPPEHLYPPARLIHRNSATYTPKVLSFLCTASFFLLSSSTLAKSCWYLLLSNSRLNRSYSSWRFTSSSLAARYTASASSAVARRRWSSSSCLCSSWRCLSSSSSSSSCLGACSASSSTWPARRWWYSFSS